MTSQLFRRIIGFYVFLLVFSVAPAAQQKHAVDEATRLIDVLKLGPNCTADEAAGFRVIEGEGAGR